MKMKGSPFLGRMKHVPTTAERAPAFSQNFSVVSSRVVTSFVAMWFGPSSV